MGTITDTTARQRCTCNAAGKSARSLVDAAFRQQQFYHKWDSDRFTGHTEWILALFREDTQGGTHDTLQGAWSGNRWYSIASELADGNAAVFNTTAWGAALEWDTLHLDSTTRQGFPRERNTARSTGLYPGACSGGATVLDVGKWPIWQIQRSVSS